MEQLPEQQQNTIEGCNHLNVISGNKFEFLNYKRKIGVVFKSERNFKNKN